MKALVYEGNETLGFRDVPEPKPAPGEELVRVEAAGICGSDMHAFLGHDARRPPPLILGHEASGTIIGGPRDGSRVTINPLVSCGRCAACKGGRENLCPDRQIISMQPREGTFAQYVSVPTSNLIEVPADVSFEKAALTEPLAVSWHSARLGLAALADGSENGALVIGGGAIGLAASLALKAMGVADITVAEPNAARAGFLETLGEKVTTKPDGTWPLVVDAVGYAVTRATASELCEPGGVIVHIGLGEDTGGLDIRRMTLQEITFIGTYTYTAEDFRDTAAALFSGRLGPLDWVERRPLAEGHQAFLDIQSHKVAVPKIILSPWQ